MQDEAHCHHRQRDTEQRRQVLGNTGNKEHAEEEEDVQLHDSQRPSISNTTIGSVTPSNIVHS